jgi:hypothetical protein
LIKYVIFALIILLHINLSASDITIWFGNPDGSPLIFRAGRIEKIPVWIHTNSDVYAAAVHIPLATDDRVIVERGGIDLYAPFDSDDVPEGFDHGWDVVSVFEPNPYPDREDYTSQGLLGFMNLMKNPNVPLHCEDTCKIMEYKIKTADSDSLRGRTFEVLIEGFEDRSKGLHFSDTLGVRTFTYEATFSPVYFVYPGDINDDLIIDENDIEVLALYLNHKTNIPLPIERGDFNDDGEIDNDDLLALRQYLKHHSR